MAIGTYDTYAELYGAVSGRNELNEPETTYELIEPFWCSVKLNTASESASENTLSNTARYTLKTHYLPTIDDTNIVEIDGQQYAIIGHESPFRSSTLITVERTSAGRRL
jgi:hypothetical protein